MYHMYNFSCNKDMSTIVDETTTKISTKDIKDTTKITTTTMKSHSPEHFSMQSHRQGETFF